MRRASPRTAAGRPLADRGINMGMPVLRKNGSKGYTTLRGIGPEGVSAATRIPAVAGPHVPARQARNDRGRGRPGRMFQHMNIGDKVILPDGEWPIVGSYPHRRYSGRPVDLATPNPVAAIRKSAYNSVLVRLTSLDSLATFKKALTTNPALIGVGGAPFRLVQARGDHNTFGLFAAGLYRGRGHGDRRLVRLPQHHVCGGRHRGREIATLRALGYRAPCRSRVSVILEAVAAVGDRGADRRRHRLDAL